MLMLNIHTIYIETDSKRPDGKPTQAVHNFKTDFKINRKSRRLTSSAESGQGLVAESCRYKGKEIPTLFEIDGGRDSVVGIETRYELDEPG